MTTKIYDEHGLIITRYCGAEGRRYQFNISHEDGFMDMSSRDLVLLITKLVESL